MKALIGKDHLVSQIWIILHTLQLLENTVTLLEGQKRQERNLPHTDVSESFSKTSKLTPWSCFFFRWNISVISLTVVLKLVVTVFLANIFRHSDRTDLIFFGHFKIISLYDRKNSLEATVMASIKSEKGEAI